jgi:hypothetical protein
MADALERLAARIEESRKVPKKRRSTRKSRAVRERELAAKKKRSQVKSLRRKVGEE